jgi:hypothetical protein
MDLLPFTPTSIFAVTSVHETERFMFYTFLQIIAILAAARMASTVAGPVVPAVAVVAVPGHGSAVAARIDGHNPGHDLRVGFGHVQTGHHCHLRRVHDGGVVA